MGKKRAPTPAQKRRSTLEQEIRSRGAAPRNIWVVRPPFEDKSLILSSDTEMELFYFLEGEPRLTDIDYSPLRMDQARAGNRHVRVFARASTSGGSKFEISLTAATTAEAARDNPFETENPRVEIGLQHLNAYAMRIANWRRILPCARRVRCHPIAALECQILLSLRQGPVTIRQITNLYSEVSSPALVYGAIACLLRKRQITSDCDTRPWSLHTLIQGAWL